MNSLYRLTFKGLHHLLQIRWLELTFSRASKIWIRHSQTREILRSFPLDGVVDGGANVGEFASLVRTSFPAVDLVCVEPIPVCAEILRKDGYRVVEAALWNSETTLDLHQPLPANTSCTVLPVSSAAGPSLRVKAIRLDQISIKGDQLLIKLDLQGVEEKALEGLGNLWDRCLGFYLEVSFGPEGTFDRIQEIMKEKGFVEYATLNQFITNGKVLEADKLWIRKELAWPASAKQFIYAP